MSNMTNDELSLLIDNIRLEIGDDARTGKDVTTVSLKPDEIAAVGLIQKNLAVDGRKFRFDAASSKLTIDSSECQSPE